VYKQENIYWHCLFRAYYKICHS